MKPFLLAALIATAAAAIASVLALRSDFTKDSALPREASVGEILIPDIYILQLLYLAI
jgi:hypothetical protein